MPGHYRHEHTDFTVKDFHEQLIKRHNYTLGFSVTKLCLHGAGPARPAQALGTSQETAASANAGHDAASGRVAARMVDGMPPMDLIVTWTTPRARSTR